MKKEITRYLSVLAIFCFSQAVFINPASAQAEVQAWGNITGIRIDGQLMDFETSIRLVGNDWSNIIATGKEKQRPKYNRDSDTQIVSTSLSNFSFVEKIENTGPGNARVDIQLTSKSDTTSTNAFFCIEIPYGDFADDSIEILKAKKNATINNNNLVPGSLTEYTGTGIRFVAVKRQLAIKWDETARIVLKVEEKNGSRYLQIYLPIYLGPLNKDQTVKQTFMIEASGEIDRNPIHLALDASATGRPFEGLGGNFRIQNLKVDPAIIQYCLNNLRVAWSRVEMPWRFWQPEKNIDPVAEAKAGRLHPTVQRAMEMAQTLSRKGIPIILTAWFPPNWAVSGKMNFRHQPGGAWGNPLNKDSTAEIYKSIADYIVYLQSSYGVVVELFSFNESDLGINIRQTGQEHADLIKGIGAYFVSRGLKTKMLLGDNSDATTYEFIYPALKDPDTHRYIGAISFHSWRGWENETLEKWADAAKQLNLPLIVGEGSIDAAAWAYPDIFQEQTYALEEINLYVRLLAICQPLSILQWQLTSDYSPLTGGGVNGKEGPLQPTRRFWNLKQLASTPKGEAYLAISCDRPNVSCAALGNNVTHAYTLHMVNNGATRKITVTGIPSKVRSFRIYITDKNRSMKDEGTVKVVKGQADFTLDAGTYTSLGSN